MQELHRHFLDVFGMNTPRFLEALKQPEQVSIRVNPSKILAGCPFENAESISWEKNGYVLSERPSFTYDPLWHAGAYYVQEASSMFIGHLLSAAGLDQLPLTALDACAAPGGKTTHLISLLHPDSLVVANEVIPKRNKILVENIIRWGMPNCIVTQAETRQIAGLEGYFDLVLADAPCSGEGMMRRDPRVMNEWSQDIVQLCATRQTSILKDIIPAIKPGGHLLYSTCTYEQAENEAQVKFLLQNGFSQNEALVPDEVAPDITRIDISTKGKTARAFRFDLHKTRGSGFFCCLLQKDDSSINNRKDNFSHSSKSALNIQKNVDLLRDWLKDPDKYAEAVFNHDIYAIPKNREYDIGYINSRLKTTYVGVLAGQQKNSLFAPAHPLALSLIGSTRIPSFEIGLTDAISYLKKVPLATETLAPPGWLLMTYKGLGLGWAKNIAGGRLNNYLPTDWRILK